MYCRRCNAERIGPHLKVASGVALRIHIRRQPVTGDVACQIGFDYFFSKECTRFFSPN